MIYKSGESDYWGCSSAGMVNITYDFQKQGSHYFLHYLKPSHMTIDYYFVYLLLLNQRFSAIQYINEIAESYSMNEMEIELLNKRIVALKTVFSFNVISDDKIFQNVYSRMFSILEIEHLIKDIVDNESQMQVLQNAGSVKAEKLSSKFLFGISLLSLFSALVDASVFFDRFNVLHSISTILGSLCVCVTVLLCVLWLIKGKN
jgi:hypothetical protein